MGMQASSKKGVLSEINVVPLIDILLVLLIIFMVITPLTPVGHRAMLPQEEAKAVTPAPEVIVVQVGAGGLRINQDAVTWEMLGPQLTEIFNRRAEKVAFLHGEGDLKFAEIARAIDVMRTAGVEAVGLLTPQTARGF